MEFVWVSDLPHPYVFLNLSPLHNEFQAMLISKSVRDLFALPDDRTLLFVTSGMSSSRTTSRVFSQVIISRFLDRISAYDVILKVSHF
jgi:hypothetical protein